MGAGMSHYRNLGGGKRDDNEPEIMRRFQHHRWHVEQISGNRLWDLLCWPPGAGGWRIALLVDVKGPSGAPTTAQAEKWKALSDKGIPVYVARTPEDVDTIVAGSAEPWGVVEARPKPSLRRASTVKAERKPSATYTPPEAARMHASVIQADAASGAQARDLPAVRAVPSASRTNHMSTKALEPSNAAEHRALLDAQEAEGTFAPAERCTPSLPCGHCMDCIGTIP